MKERGREEEGEGGMLKRREEQSKGRKDND